MMRAFCTAAALAALALPASAAELRPLSQNGWCLDGGGEIQPGVNRVVLAACNGEQTQNFRRGEERTIYVGSLCLQALKQGEQIGVVAARCHGRDGQRWAMTRDGRLSPGEELCLTVEGEGASARLPLTACKQPPDDAGAQKWAIYGRFE